MPRTVEFTQKREEEQARLGPLGIIGLNNRLATQTTIQRLTSKELFDPGYSRENAGSKGINTLMVGLGNKHHGRRDSGKDGVTRQQFIQEIIEKGRYPAPSSGQQNPTLYLAVPFITDQEAAQIARDTHREVCYTNTSLKLDIDIRGDLHLRPKIEGSMAFMSPSSEKKVVPEKSVYYPRHARMNAIANKVREAPIESSREVARRRLDLVGNDGCLEVIRELDREESLQKEICSSEIGGGGHLSVDHYSGNRTTVLEIHGLIPNLVSRKIMHYNEAKIAKIIACLKLNKNRGKGKIPLAVLTGCDIPANVAARIAREIGRPLLVGNDAKVNGVGLKVKEGYSGDFKLYCKKGFSIVYPDKPSEKINSNFVLLPRAPAMSQKIEQQKMDAYRHPTVVSALQQSQPPQQEEEQQQKEILEGQFFSLEAGYTRDLQKINDDHFNAEEMKRLKLERTGAYRAAKKELMLQLDVLGYVLCTDTKGFVAKRQPDGAPQHPTRVASPPQRALAGRPRR